MAEGPAPSSGLCGGAERGAGERPTGADGTPGHSRAALEGNIRPRAGLEKYEPGESPAEKVAQEQLAPFCPRSPPCTQLLSEVR